VANGLLASETRDKVALGVVPAGRGPGVARMLGGARGPEAALARACRTPPRAVDVGLATFAGGAARYFVNVAGLGFDAAVAERAAASRLPGTTAPYLGGLLAALSRHRNRQMMVAADGTAFAGPALAVVVANGRYFGGGFAIVPSAAIDDGLLDLALIGDLSRLELLRVVPRVYRGRHVDHPRFTHLAARSVRVETAGPARVQLDGEVVGCAPVTFSVAPGALRLAG
jgi:diacylglycerol kinase family enzyme